MYMVRDVFSCKRGRAPEVADDMRAWQKWLISTGNTTAKVYADMSGPFDTVVMEFEVESLDEYYVMERGLYIEPDPDTARLTSHLNEAATSGCREIYNPRFLYPSAAIAISCYASPKCEILSSEDAYSDTAV